LLVCDQPLVETLRSDREHQIDFTSANGASGEANQLPGGSFTPLWISAFHRALFH
jgi:hypothetical protein